MSKRTQALAEIADSVNMVGIVTSAIARKTTCTSMCLLLHGPKVTVSLFQAAALASLSVSLTEAHYCLIFLQTLCSLCSPKLMGCVEDLLNSKVHTCSYIYVEQMFLVPIRESHVLCFVPSQSLSFSIKYFSFCTH